MIVHHASTYVALVQHLERLLWATRYRDILPAIKTVDYLIKDLGFENAAVHLPALERIRHHIQGDPLNPKNFNYDANLDSNTLNYLRNVVQAIYANLDKEAHARRMGVLDSSAASARLRHFQTIPLTAAQVHLLRETLGDLETGHYSSAIVMAWNFTYDCIRQWVFNNRLGPFNQWLRDHYHRDEIGSYDDFYLRDAPHERLVLDVYRETNIVDGTTHDHLCQALRFRHNYAHPDFKQPSIHKANAHIENLLDVLAGEPFRIGRS